MTVEVCAAPRPTASAWTGIGTATVSGGDGNAVIELPHRLCRSMRTAPDVPDAMYRMKRIILLSLIGAATAAHTKPAVVVGPHEAVQKEFVLDIDPSTVAVSNEWQTASEPRPFDERWRIVSDLNDDGVDDLILSDPNEASGNVGISWMVYLRDNGLWRYIGDHCHPIRPKQAHVTPHIASLFG